MYFFKTISLFKWQCALFIYLCECACCADYVVCGERKKGVAKFETAPDYSSAQNAKDRKTIMTINELIIKMGL